MIMSAHCLWIWVINQHLCRFWLVHPQAQGWVVSAPYVRTPPRTSRLIWAWFSHSKGRSTRGPETQNVSWRLILGLLVHTFYRTKEGTKLAHVQKRADSSSLVRRAANDMAKRVDTGEDEDDCQHNQLSTAIFPATSSTNLHSRGLWTFLCVYLIFIVK